jgi:hypothetical protein
MLDSQAHQFRASTEVPVSIGDMDVSEVRGQYGQARLNFLTGAIPMQQGLQGEAMTEVMKARSVARRRAAQPDLP